LSHTVSEIRLSASALIEPLAERAFALVPSARSSARSRQHH
jgi:hypothetical protein